MTEKTFETKPLTGSLFKVKEKNSENSPDFTGNIVDDQGRKFRISAWSRTSKNGNKVIISLQNLNKMSRLELKMVRMMCRSKQMEVAYHSKGRSFTAQS